MFVVQEPCLELEYPDLKQWAIDRDNDTLTITFQRDGTDASERELVLGTRDVRLTPRRRSPCWVLTPFVCFVKQPGKLSEVLSSTMRKLFPSAVIHGTAGGVFVDFSRWTSPVP